MKGKGVITIAGLIATMLVMAPLSHADVIWIPMPTKIEKFKEVAKEGGLDLYGTDESDGFVEDNGTRVKVVTYRWVEADELEVLQRAALEARR